MPRANRPYMPDHGIQGPDEGTGLLPWSWPDGRPHSPTRWAWDS